VSSDYRWTTSPGFSAPRALVVAVTLVVSMILGVGVASAHAKPAHKKSHIEFAKPYTTFSDGVSIIHNVGGLKGFTERPVCNNSALVVLNYLVEWGTAGGDASLQTILNVVEETSWQGPITSTLVGILNEEVANSHSTVFSIAKIPPSIVIRSCQSNPSTTADWTNALHQSYNMWQVAK
jgi:hypothetical protein